MRISEAQLKGDSPCAFIQLAE